ncbi:asparagine synthase C-terminal domain-containing protein [Micromonospora sp. CPCC 205539]|uniref:asparagine synthase C-terminal domain-containing protein n=1 Tax=Micromonospora sp. CPCC 205539 TaxID=3122408 RepID=UPI002FEFE255
MLRPTPFDLATGTVLGVDTPPPHRAASSGIADPLGALDAAVLPALSRPPCVVSFSGGLDSSLVLAVAVRAARREGLPDPVPVTWRFAGAPRADESDWQERVVRALRIGESWQILRAADDLDLIGPVARRLLHRYGVVHPVNLHLHLPLAELATGGSLLTGAGGDQILAGWRRPPAASLRARLWWLRHDVGTRRGPADLFGWLRPAVAREVHRAHRAEQRAEPRRLRDRIAWHLRRRDLRITCSALAGLAADHQATAVQPLLDEGFVAALALLAGDRRGVSRDALLAEIVRGALPAEVTAPRRKARFLEVFFRTPTREFVRAWDGTGVDPHLVDADALRAAWARWPIPGGTASLVQHLWLAANPAEPNRPTGSAGRQDNLEVRS